LNHDLDGYICAKDKNLLIKAGMLIEELSGNGGGPESMVAVNLVNEKCDTINSCFMHVTEDITDFNNKQEE